MRAIPEWKLLLLAISSVLLLLVSETSYTYFSSDITVHPLNRETRSNVIDQNEAMWQWWWWRLDNSGVGGTSCSGNQILIHLNNSKVTICQPCPICSEGTILSPPCGSILTQDTVIECKPPFTKALTGNKQEMLNKRNKNAPHGNSKDDGSIGSQNVNRTAWPSMDARDIYDEEELEESSLSEVAELHSFLSPTQVVQRITTVTPPTQTFLLKAFRRWRQRRVNPKVPTSKQAARPRPSAEQPIPEQISKETCSFTASSCVLGGFLGTSLTCLLPGSALLWLLWSLRKRKGWCRWNSDTELSESEVEDMPDYYEKVDHMNATSASYPVTSVNLKHLNLSEIPPDLEDLLVKTMDVPRRRRGGERRYGWQKVGAAFKISKDDLAYLNIEYKRDKGSPTSTLLSILGTKGKTVSDLVNVLRSPKVNLPNVASQIGRYIKEANKFQ